MVMILTRIPANKEMINLIVVVLIKGEMQCVTTIRKMFDNLVNLRMICKLCDRNKRISYINTTDVIKQTQTLLLMISILRSTLMVLALQLQVQSKALIMSMTIK